jgi:hypothetical protein
MYVRVYVFVRVPASALTLRLRAQLGAADSASYGVCVCAWTETRALEGNALVIPLTPEPQKAHGSGVSSALRQHWRD